MKQQRLFKCKSLNEFGGDLLTGKRKSQRPLSYKKPIHLILRTQKMLHNNYLSPRNHELVKIVRTISHRYQVRIYSCALNWSHIHLVILTPTRAAYIDFVRQFSAQFVLYLSRKHKIILTGLFRIRPYTRIAAWGLAFKKLCRYVEINIAESFNFNIKEITDYKNLWTRRISMPP